MTTVLVLRALGLGDVLTGVPALRGIRRAWPAARIVLAAPSGIGGWLRDLGVVDDVLPTEGVHALPGALAWHGSGHVAVNLHGRGPQSHRLLEATRPTSLVAFASTDAGHDARPPWRDDEHEVERWCRLVRSVGGDCSPTDLRLPAPRAGVGAPDEQAAAERRQRAPVVVHPGAAYGSRRWPVERWGSVVAWLVDEGHDVVLTGSDAERGLCDAVRSAAADRAAAAAVGPAVVGRPPRATVRSAAGRMSLPQLAATVAGARLLLCGDTGVAHLGTALGTPSVLLFGPTSPARWGPLVDLDRHTVLWHGDGTGDPRSDVLDPALAAIGVEEVRAAADRLLEP